MTALSTDTCESRDSDPDYGLFELSKSRGCLRVMSRAHAELDVDWGMRMWHGTWMYHCCSSVLYRVLCTLELVGFLANLRPMVCLDCGVSPGLATHSLITWWRCKTAPYAIGTMPRHLGRGAAVAVGGLWWLLGPPDTCAQCCTVHLPSATYLRGAGRRT